MTDLRTQKTMRSLKTAFFELLEQSRFEDITVKQICESAEIRRATFYSHFADKYEFLSFFIREMRNEFMENMEHRLPETPTESFSYYDQLFHELMTFFRSHPQIVRNLKNSQAQPVMMNLFTVEVEKSVFSYLQACQPDNDNMNKMKASFYAGGILQLVKLWLDHPDQYEIDKINWLKYLTPMPSVRSE